MIVLYLIIFITSACRAQTSGLMFEQTRMTNQLLQAEASVQSALDTYQSSFNNSASPQTLSCISSDFANSSNKADALNPVKSITFGYLAGSDNSKGGCTNSVFNTAGDDNKGQFIVEVTFKTLSEYPDISPLLAGKSILFVAMGQSTSNSSCYDIMTSGSSSNVKSSYSSLSSFVCINKNQRCGNGSIDTQSNGTCNSSMSSVNNSERAAFFYAQNQHVSLLNTYTGTAFDLCTVADSRANMMNQRSDWSHSC